jgi:tetratricopeptide (TPR) repeat protein
MHRWAMPVAVVLLAACTSAPRSRSEPPRDRAAAARGDGLEAVRAEVRLVLRAGMPSPSQCSEWVARLERLHEQHGEPYAVALLDASKILTTCGRRSEAKAVLDRVVRSGPRWARAEAWVGLAGLHRHGGRHADAERCLRTALRVDPGLVGAQLALARLLTDRFEVGREHAHFVEAEAIYRRGIEAEPPVRAARVGLARLYMWKAADDPRLAIQAMLLLGPPDDWEKDPSYAEVGVIHGLERQLAGDEPSAHRAFAMACELGDAEGCARAGVLLVSMRDYASGAEALARALEDPRFAENREVLRARGRAFLGLHQLGRAQRVFERLVALDPRDAANHFDLALLAVAEAEGTRDDEDTRELHLADAARHYRAFVRLAGDDLAEAREHAIDFLRRYAAVDDEER